jgi:DNA-binding MarR family transcriptional regulator
MRRRITIQELTELQSAHWPEAASPVPQMMIRMFRARDLVLRNSRAVAAAQGVSFTEFEVLAALRSQPPPHELLPTELYGAVLITSGGMTKVLQALEQRHLITRGTAEDRRSKPVRLTSRGIRLAERVMREIIAADTRLIAAAMSEREKDGLALLLRKLLAALEREATISAPS